MWVGGALQLALLAVASVLAALVLLIALRRLARERIEHRLARRHARVRPALLRALAEDDVDTRALDGVAASDVPVLESLVWSMLTKVRGEARASLTRWLVERGSVDRALAATRSRSVVRRAIAIEQLGRAGVESTAPAVRRLLDDREPEVRVVAARALGKIGGTDAVPALLGSLTGRRSVPASIVAMALLHIGPRATSSLVHGLHDHAPIVRATSAELIGMHGDLSAVKELVFMVQSDADVPVRTSAANALGRIGSPQGVPTLLRSLNAGEPLALRLASARALGLIGGADAVQRLKDALLQDPHVATIAAEALSGMGAAGLDALRSVAQDGAAATAATSAASTWLLRREMVADVRRRRGAAGAHA